MTFSLDDLSVDRLHQWKSAKWATYPDDVLPAWIAEMDFPTAQVIRDAVVQSIEASETNYPQPHSDSGLPEACAMWLGRRFGMQIAPEQISVVGDVVQGIESAIDLFTRPGSAVVVMTPSYPPFFMVVEKAGRAVSGVPMQWDGGRPTFDLDGIDAALAAGAGSVLLCNPHNPLGRVFSAEELGGLVTVVERHGARVIADEVHAPLVYPGSAFVPYSTVSEVARQHSVTVTSASKGWNVAGLKCAEMVLTSDRDREIWSKASMLFTHGASTVGVVANRVAFTDGEPWLEETVRYLDGNRRALGELLGDLLPEVGYTAPEATYLAWLDCRSLGLENPAEFFLQDARVAVSDGGMFGAGGEGHVRLNFATSRGILTEIVERIAGAVRARGG
jgi:cysteine-S-conjugate beta-lyase